VPSGGLNVFARTMSAGTVDLPADPPVTARGQLGKRRRRRFPGPAEGLRLHTDGGLDRCELASLDADGAGTGTSSDRPTQTRANPARRSDPVPSTMP